MDFCTTQEAEYIYIQGKGKREKGKGMRLLNSKLLQLD